MVTNALIESGQFRVVERQRIAQGVILEKQMNAANQTSGDVAQKQLRGARYIFEGTVSEANAGATQRQGGISIGGLTLGGGKNKDTIAIVRDARWAAAQVSATEIAVVAIVPKGYDSTK